jgi:hypothetical protein
MYMEYCDRANYLANKILEVSYEDILTKSYIETYSHRQQ